jgi:superfamily II DNA or RNA helicase
MARTDSALPVSDLALWPHQVDALSTLSRFIKSQGAKPRRSALVQMPTGTGKSGVIAVAAQRLVTGGDVLLLSPWDALVDQLTRDVHERFWRLIGADPPKTKHVGRLLPSTAWKILSEHKAPAIWTSTISTLQQLHSEHDRAYDELAHRVKLVIVDEGHYEPAPSWAKAVRGLRRPTALFTATPYRNDFKIFQVDRDFCYFYSHERAEDDRFIRRLQFTGQEFDSVPSFCDGLLDAWKRLPRSEERPRVTVRCATKNSVQAVTSALDQRGVSVIGVHERFESAGGTKLKRDVPNPEVETAQFWVHQNKLIEGIDEPGFRIVAFFEPLSSERAFVQQVGRVLRNPKRKVRQYAWVFSDPRRGLEESWLAYRFYDSQVGEESLLQTPRDFARVQPSIQYLTRRFRQRLDITNPRVYEDFDYPRSTTVFVVPEDYSLKGLVNAVEQQWEEYDFDLQPVLSPDEDTRLHPYIAVSNSPLLLRKAFVEFEIGFTIYRRIRNYLFFYDSQGNVPDVLASLRRVESPALQRLFTGTEARLNTVSLLNTNLGRQSARRRVLQAYSIGELGPDLADHAQFASTVTGLTRGPKWIAGPPIPRYVGLTRSHIRDRVGGANPFDAYMRWLEYLADALDDRSVESLAVFDRYAEVVGAPQDPTPISVLLDFDQTTFEGGSIGAPRTLSIDDVCMQVRGGRFECVANAVAHHVSVRWDPQTSRYLLDCPSLDNSFSMKDALGNRRAASLVAYLNQAQAFRIIPASVSRDYCIYASGRFFRPRFLWGRTPRAPHLELLQLLEPVPELRTIVTEKGARKSAKPEGWAQGSLFSLIDRLGVGTGMAAAFGGVSLLVCDDMGTEIADFIALKASDRRAIAIHAKAFSVPRPLSASALHEVSSQALKNLGYFQPYFVGNPKNLDRWDRQWNGPPVGRVASRIRKGGPITGHEAWRKIRAALLDPQTVREIWLILGQGLSKSALEAEMQRPNPAAEALQIIYSLQATWGAVSSVGGRLRIFCSP